MFLIEQVVFSVDDVTDKVTVTDEVTANTAHGIMRERWFALPCTGKPCTGKPCTGKPCTDKPDTSEPNSLASVRAVNKSNGAPPAVGAVDWELKLGDSFATGWSCQSDEGAQADGVRDESHSTIANDEVSTAGMERVRCTRAVCCDGQTKNRLCDALGGVCQTANVVAIGNVEGNRTTQHAFRIGCRAKQNDVAGRS